MDILDFQLRHVAEATFLAQKLHDEARHQVDLPNAALPDLSRLVNGLGVVCMENGRMVGFMGATGPWTNQFGTQATGVYAPLETSGVVGENPVRIWRRMYQAAAAKWVAAGAGWHAITLHAQDAAAQHALWQYGFGMRCADAIRRAAPMCAAPVPGIICRELQDGSAVQALRMSLDRHLCQSPCFMTHGDADLTNWLNGIAGRQSRIFAALANEVPVAYVEVGGSGETYFSEHPTVANICGTFCAEEWRGKGVSRLLLNNVLQTLQGEDLRYLGVDYETINPTAASFWTKYFTPYTLSLVRRVDRL